MHISFSPDVGYLTPPVSILLHARQRLDKTNDCSLYLITCLCSSDILICNDLLLFNKPLMLKDFGNQNCAQLSTLYKSIDGTELLNATL